MSACQPESCCNVGFAANVRYISQSFLYVLSVGVLVASKRSVGLIAEVDGTDARRVRSYVQVGHYGREKFTNNVDAFELDTSGHVDNEEQAYATSASCITHTYRTQTLFTR